MSPLTPTLQSLLARIAELEATLAAERERSARLVKKLAALQTATTFILR